MSARFGRRGRRISALVGGLAAFFGLLGLMFFGALPASAASHRPAAAAPKTVHLELLPTQVFTRTDIALKKNDLVKVTASGVIHFGGGRIAGLEAGGIPWGAECRAVARGLALTTPWPARGVACWSLIAKVGRTGRPFEIGPETTFRAPRAGLLILGVNDNFVHDNTGQWLVTVAVTPLAVAGPPTTVPATVPGTSTGSAKKSSSTGLIFLIGGLLVVGLLVLLFFLARRRRSNNEPEPVVAPHLQGLAPPVAPHLQGLAPVVAPAPEPEPVMAAVAPGAAAIAESIDVNIFEVEFSNGLTMRVGYNHFPEGIDLRWRVTQTRIPVAVGSFRTQGGGSTNHFETITLGVKLEGRDAQPDGADVQFDWMINDVPFRYSVRRDPNC